MIQTLFNYYTRTEFKQLTRQMAYNRWTADQQSVDRMVWGADSNYYPPIVNKSIVTIF